MQCLIAVSLIFLVKRDSSVCNNIYLTIKFLRINLISFFRNRSLLCLIVFVKRHFHPDWFIWNKSLFMYEMMKISWKQHVKWMKNCVLSNYLNRPQCITASVATSAVWWRLPLLCHHVALSRSVLRNRGKGAIAPHRFWQISWPYSNHGGKLCPPYYYLPIRIFRPSYGPVSLCYMACLAKELAHHHDLYLSYSFSMTGHFPVKWGHP